MYRGTVRIPEHNPNQSLRNWAQFPRQLKQAVPSCRFYGLGWSLNDYLGRLVVSHGGGYDGMFSRVVLVPEEGLAMAVFTNSMTSISTAITNTVLDAYLGGEEQNWSRPCS